MNNSNVIDFSLIAAGMPGIRSPPIDLSLICDRHDLALRPDPVLFDLGASLDDILCEGSILNPPPLTLTLRKARVAADHAPSPVPQTEFGFPSAAIALIISGLKL